MVYAVLIIEDDPMVLSINKRYVNKLSDFEVRATAASFAEATQLLEKDQSFDLLLIDIHLTNDSGLDIVKWLRTNDYDTDFIMITAISEKQTIALCRQYGALDFILKPFQFDRVKKSLLKFKSQRELLNDKGSLNQAAIDNLYWTKASDYEEELILEKGLTKETLQLILSIIDSFNKGFTIEELTSKSSLSHVSVRKYVRYLEDQGKLEASYTYGTVGRPTMTYHKVQ